MRVEPGRPTRNALWLLAAEVVGKGSNFVLVVIVARGVGATGYGYFNFALSFIPLFLIFANWGMDSALVREISRARERASELFASAFVLLGALGLVGLALSLGSAVFFVHGGRIYLAVAILGVALFLDEQSSLVGAVFKAFERMEFHGIVVLANRLMSMALALTAVLVGGGLVAVCLAYLAGSVGALVFGWLILTTRFRPVRLRSARRETVAELFGLGAPLGLAGFLNMAVYRLDTVLLQAIRGPAQVAIYGVAYRFFESSLFFSWVLANVALPRLARQQRTPEARRTFDVTATTLLSFYLPLAVVAPFVSQFVVTKLFSDRYAAAGDLVPPLVAASLFYGLAHLGRMGAIALGDRRRVVAVAATILAVNLGLNAWLIPVYGYTAAAWVTFGTEVLEAILLVGLFVRGDAGALPRLFAIPAVASATLAGILVGFHLRDLAAIVVAIPTYPVLLCVAAWLFGPEDAKALRRLVRRPRPSVDSPTFGSP